MIGLGYILLFGLYFWAIKVAVKAIMGWAESRNRSARRWGWATAIGLLSFVFWDVIPVYSLHAYQCSQNAGFTVHKTLDGWKRENPGVAETLTPTEGAPMIEEGKLRRFLLNQRFVWDTTRSPVWHTLYKQHQKIVDVQTGDVMAEEVDFYTSLNTPWVAHSSSLGDYKIWMNIQGCNVDSNRDKWLVNGDAFISLKRQFKSLNSGE